MTSKTSCPPYNLLGNLFWGGLVFCWYFKKIYFAKTLFLRIVCRTRARGTYGPTVKNLTLTFWPRIFSWPVHMYRKSPRKFERKFQCKIFHGRPLFVEVPKIRTSPNASFWLIWPNWDMKEMEMWPKAIMVWKYDGSRPTLQKISEVSSPGPEIWFFYKKNQWFAIKPTVQHMGSSAQDGENEQYLS